MFHHYHHITLGSISYNYIINEYLVFSEAEHCHCAVTGGRSKLEQFWMELETVNAGLKPRVRMPVKKSFKLIIKGLY